MANLIESDNRVAVDSQQPTVPYSGPDNRVAVDSGMSGSAAPYTPQISVDDLADKMAKASGYNAKDLAATGDIIKGEGAESIYASVLSQQDSFKKWQEYANDLEVKKLPYKPYVVWKREGVAVKPTTTKKVEQVGPAGQGPAAPAGQWPKSDADDKVLIDAQQPTTPHVSEKYDDTVLIDALQPTAPLSTEAPSRLPPPTATSPIATKPKDISSAPYKKYSEMSLEQLEEEEGMLKNLLLTGENKGIVLDKINLENNLKLIYQLKRLKFSGESKLKGSKSRYSVAVKPDALGKSKEAPLKKKAEPVKFYSKAMEGIPLLKEIFVNLTNPLAATEAHAAAMTDEEFDNIGSALLTLSEKDLSKMPKEDIVKAAENAMNKMTGGGGGGW
ncbi:MAG: hypothetical protein WCT23_08575 [Candidatus Neomarinimicrobiota bacterium]